MIDRLREQIQERLDQLARRGRPPAQGARRARPALSRSARDASPPRGRGSKAAKPPPRSTKRAPGPTNEHASDSPPSPDSARRDQGRRTRRPRRRRGDDRRRGCRQGGPPARDRLDDAVEARQVRRSGEGRARLSTHGCRTLLAGGVASRRSLLFTPGGRRYRRLVLPLGFRFDVDAVLVGDVAHRSDCDQVPHPWPHDAVSVRAAGVYRAQRCPRECRHCRPPFETVLSNELERAERGESRGPAGYGLSLRSAIR